jgi:uncharacterized membrane protein YdbT with pleckstrin-like domain
MDSINLKPHPKLFRKSVYILLTISSLLLIVGILLQLLVPLAPRASFGQVSIIVWPIVFGIIFLKWIISLPLISLWIKNLDYFIEEDRIRIHKGFITKIQQNIPYRAITDFILQRSLYDRVLGIASIRIQTAGQSATPTGYEGNLAGLVEWDERLSELRLRLKRYESSPTQVAVKPPEDTLPSNDIFKAIFFELKQIRELLEKSKN